MNVLSLRAPVRSGELPIEQLAANNSRSQAQKLAEVSRQFEAVLLRQILGQARKPVFHSKINQESSTTGIYQDMVTNQLADGISRSGSFGLARSLESQLVQQTLPVAAAAAEQKP